MKKRRKKREDQNRNILWPRNCRCDHTHMLPKSRF